MNSTIITIEWLAEQNVQPVADGDMVAVYSHEGSEIARGVFNYTGGSGWTATGQVGDREFTTWLVLPGQTVWIDNDGRFVYFSHE